MSDQVPERPEHSIAMWGAPGSGKTTMLAALSLALLQKRSDWKLVGADQQSIGELTQKSMALARKEFPRATINIERFRWLLIGNAQQLEKRFGGRPKALPAPRVGFNLIDPPGGMYGEKVGIEQTELLENLEQSRGIIYLFDPIREFDKGDAFNHLHIALMQLAGQILGPDTATEGKLPHYLAVCITKFDDLRVLDTAKNLGIVTTDPEDPHGFPTVDEEDAQTLFRSLCEISASGTAGFVLNALEQYFRPDRIKFFVTSSIGFYLKPGTSAFNDRDFQNIVPISPDAVDGQSSSVTYQIRDLARPINVREPVIWLAERLFAEQPAARSGR